MKKSLFMALLIFPLAIAGQSWKSKPLSILAFNNATMLPPASLTAAFNQPLHFGITANYEFGWKEFPKHKWYQNAGLAYFYHRFVYQAILLNTQAGYRWKISDFSAEAYLQAGYMHAFYLTDRCVPETDGSYTARKGAGKPQMTFGAGIGLGYDFGKDEKIRRILMGYHFWMQMPFVKGYVPLLPNGSLYIGFQFNLE